MDSSWVRSHRLFLAFSGLSCLLLLLGSFAFAQTSNTSLNGVVKDAQDRVIPNATVTLTNTGTSTVRTQKTGGEGRYSFDLLTPGDYRLDVQATGFRKQMFQNIHVLIANANTLDVHMEVGTLTETVEVSAQSNQVMVDTQDANLGNNFENQQITQLPLEARNVLSLLTLQPGVTKEGYVAGARSDQSNVTLDGVDINDAQTTTVSSSRDNPTISTTLAGPVSGPVLRLNAEAIEEFRVSTITSDAAAGHSSGAQIELVTKSGTNNLHGSLFESHRNTITTANDYFNNLNGTPRPALIRNTFSGGVGGPSIKNRLFLFYNYEGRRDASAQSTDPRTVPLPSLGQGLVKFPNAAGPAGSLITLAPADIAAIFPDTGGENPAAVQAIAAAAAKYTANDFTIGDSKPGNLLNTAGFRFNAPAPLSQNSHVARLDLNITSKQTMFFRTNVIYDHDSSVSLPFFT